MEANTQISYSLKKLNAQRKGISKFRRRRLVKTTIGNQTNIPFQIRKENNQITCVDIYAQHNGCTRSNNQETSGPSEVKNERILAWIFVRST